MTQKFTKLLFILLFAFAFVHGQDSTASRKKVNGIAAIPMINYNRTQGVVLGAIVSNYFKINKKDTISPSSNVGVAGIYTAAEELCAISIFTTIFSTKTDGVYGLAAGSLDINFQFYLEDPVTSTGNFSDYSTKANLVVLQVQRNIFKRDLLWSHSFIYQIICYF